MEDILGMHSIAAASLPRPSETEPKWFVFETSCYAAIECMPISSMFKIYFLCKYGTEFLLSLPENCEPCGTTSNWCLASFRPKKWFGISLSNS